MPTMQGIVERIDRERVDLEGEALFRFLSRDDVDGLTRLSFAPSMLYYLMGFKDVLGSLYRPDPQTKLDRYINAYCGEDAEHWRWYLSDLEKLGFSIRTWGESIPDFCNEVWSEATNANRRTIFSLVHAAMSSSDPLFALSLISVFEATGVVFIGHTRKAALALGMDDELQYFGREHFEEEFGHSVKSRDLVAYEMSDELYALTERTVSGLFEDYRLLFDCWHAHVGHYEVAAAPLAGA